MVLKAVNGAEASKPFPLPSDIHLMEAQVGLRRLVQLREKRACLWGLRGRELAHGKMCARHQDGRIRLLLSCIVSPRCALQCPGTGSRTRGPVAGGLSGVVTSGVSEARADGLWVPRTVCVCRQSGWRSEFLANSGGALPCPLPVCAEAARRQAPDGW